MNDYSPWGKGKQSHRVNIGTMVESSSIQCYTDVGKSENQNGEGILMIVELRKKAQITIPREYVVALGLAEGSVLDVSLEDGTIRLTPVEIIPRRTPTILDIGNEGIKSGPDKYAEGPIHGEPGNDPFDPDRNGKG
jgi:bifunctional DNA-binding transcriptional regulator/antitoxin component of YhaV-PrlF toxin-antitoxin module